ncbi:hypothetical protein [Flavitalea sp.]|nr:hypothetical protein [Flavitalea sp.]
MEHGDIDMSGINMIYLYQRYQGEGLIFTIQRNGEYIIDIVRGYERWLELHERPTERSNEYGAMLNDFFVFNDRKFTRE